MKTARFLVFLWCGSCLSFLFASTTFAEDSPASPKTVKDAAQVAEIRSHYHLDELSKVPERFPAEEYKADGVQSFFYRGVDYHGQPTRVFAYYGTPEKDESNPTKKFPAMVLIHGGGGTAFDRWVKLWNSRGYAAISMDLCGSVPEGTYGKWKRHEHAGPLGWDHSFNQLSDPIEDQWTYQAVCAAALAHTLIRSFPEIDTERIGATGISWGGYMTCVVAGVDHRFQFAAPVYGCGYLSTNSAWLGAFEKLGPEQTELWMSQWDPSVYLPFAKMPMLWVNGTNDFAYPMDSWQKSYRLPPGPRTLSLRVRMPHNHAPDGEGPEEIRWFADSLFGRGEPLAKITKQGLTDTEIWAEYQSSTPITRAEVCYTRDVGKWQERNWETLPAVIEPTTNRVSAPPPDGMKVGYLNLIDDRGAIVSTEHIER